MILSPSLLRLPGQHIHGGLDGLSHSSALPGRSGSVQSPAVSHPRMSHGGAECRRDLARKLRAGGLEGITACGVIGRTTVWL